MVVATAPGLIGREAEFGRVASLLAGEGRGLAAALVEGAAGVGKSALVHAVGRHARQTGWLTLSSAPTQSEARYAYVGLADLIGPLATAEAIAGLPPPQRRALKVALRLADADPGPAFEVPLVGLAAQRLLADEAARRPLLLILDDVQWLDAASAAVVEFALRRTTARVGVLLTRRADQPGRPALGLDRYVEPDASVTVWLDGLIPAELRDLIETRLGVRLAHLALRRLHAVCGGNPFYALQIVEAALARNGSVAATDALALPDSLHAVLDDRLTATDDRLRRLLLIVAAMAAPTVTGARRALDDPSTDVTGESFEATVARAERARLLTVTDDRLAFTHPLFASAAYDRATAPERRAVHRLLAGVEPELETQARHLGLATLGPDPVVAAALEAAALDARSRGATEIAVDLLRLAVSRTPEGDGGRRDVLLGEAMFEAGDITATAAWLDERLTSLPPGTLRARALITRGVAEWYRSDGPAASAFLTAAIDDARDDPALLGQLYSRLAIFSDGDAGQARERAARAVEVLGLAGESDLLACALSNLFYYEVLSGRAPRPELLDRGLLMEDPRGSVDQSTTPGFWYLALDRWEQARDRFQTMLDRDRSRGDLSSEPELLTRLGEVAAHSTDWPAAQRYARAASAAARQLGHDGSYQPSGRLRLLLDVFGGDVGRAATAALGEADRFAEQGEHLAAASYLAVATFAAASANDPRRVVTLTGRTAHHLAAVGIAEPLGRLDPAPERAEALVVLGDLDAAEALLDAIARRLDRIPRPWLAAAHLRASAQLAAARGDMNHAISLTETRGVPDWSRFEQARVLLVRGRLLRRARRGNAAARCLAEAGETFAALGAGAWSAQVSDALSRVRRRSADPDALTATERRIAALAAAGATNLEMAVELHMSHKTVEVHLTHIYRKLNIRSRGELGAAVGSGRRL